MSKDIVQVGPLQRGRINHANALNNVFPVARQRNVKFVIGSSLNAGFISGSPRYNYGKTSWNIPRQYIEKRERLRAVAAQFGADLRTAALQFSAAREIRAVRGAHAPVLILLSSAGQALASVRADAGFAAGLSKPLRLSHLRDRLLETVGEQRGTSAGAVPLVACDVGSPLPLRILLAEDNAINQKVALRLLERLGYEADIVGDGRQALARLDHAVYDVILMDVQMPEMDGLEASRAICARWAASEHPRIIAMTAEAMQGDREKSLAAGMDDYIVKPVTLDRLAAALAKCRPWAAAPAAGAAAVPPIEKQKIAAGTALDRDVLHQLREDLGGPAALREVIRSFLDQTPSVLSALRDAAARADVPSIRRAAHMIKGTSSTLGARELSEQCAEIERVGQTGCIADAGSRVIAIEASYRTIEAALKAEIERPRP